MSSLLFVLLFGFSSAFASNDDLGARETIRVLNAYNGIKLGILPNPDQKKADVLLKEFRWSSDTLKDLHEKIGAENQGNTPCLTFLKNTSNALDDFKGAIMVSLNENTKKPTRVLARARAEILKSILFTNLLLLKADKEAGINSFDDGAGVQCKYYDREAWTLFYSQLLEKIRNLSNHVFGRHFSHTTDILQDLNQLSQNKHQREISTYLSFITFQLAASIVLWETAVPAMLAKVAFLSNYLAPARFIFFTTFMGAEMLFWQNLDEHLIFSDQETFQISNTPDNWLNLMTEEENFFKTPMDSPDVYFQFYLELATRENELIGSFLIMARPIIRNAVEKYGNIDNAIAKLQNLDTF